VNTVSRIEHRAALEAELGCETSDAALALREQAERAHYHALKDDLLCKTPGAIGRFAVGNGEQLAEIASLVMQHWDDPVAAGRAIRQKFNSWMWEAAEEMAG
jgi:hypothetical protein